MAQESTAGGDGDDCSVKALDAQDMRRGRMPGGFQLILYFYVFSFSLDVLFGGIEAGYEECLS